MARRFHPDLRASTLILAAAAFAVSVGAARADQVVYFVNGKAITVKKVEKGDRLTILEIEGGGRIGIPTIQIDRIEELTLSAAVPQATVPAVIPATPPPQTANQAPPPAAPAAPMPTGPGTGGHVAVNSPANGAQPLAIGGDPSDEVPRPRAGLQGAQAPAGSNPSAAMQAQQRQRNMSMQGGPGGFQRGRGGRNDYARGRLPAGASLPPKGSPNAGGQAEQPGAAAPQQPPAGAPTAPPPTASAPPPPPPDPAETDAGNPDGAADEGAAPEAGDDTPAADDGDSGH